MALTFPADCNTPPLRTEYCYRAQELLKRIHNHMGWWYRGFDFVRDAQGKTIRNTEGEVVLDLNKPWTQVQWNKLPQKIKSRYPYVGQLPQADWDNFKSNVFEPIFQRIVQGILINRELLSNSNAWQINVEDI